VDFYANEYHAATPACCSGLAWIRCRPTGNTCPSVTTGVQAPSWYPARRSLAVRPAPGGAGRRAGVRAVPADGFEAEVGFVVGVGSRWVPRSAWASSRPRVRGVPAQRLVLPRPAGLESRPLGPFLGKSFGTSISPWIVPLDALEQARSARRRADPELLPYLADTQPWGLDLALEVRAERAGGVTPALCHHVLDAGADAGPHDRERCLDPYGRHVRSGTRQRPGPGPARLPAGIELGRRRTASGCPTGPSGRSCRTTTR